MLRQTPLRGEGGGVFVWCLPANARMRAVNIVVRAPVGQRGAGMGQRREQGFVQQFVGQPPIEAFDKGVLGRLSRRDAEPLMRHWFAPNGEGQSTLRLSAKARMAFEVNSVPLSEMIIAGFPRRSMIAANSRATRTPDSDVSATKARHSRVQLSTTVSVRNRRPSAR